MTAGDALDRRRRAMVEDDLAGRGMRDRRVLDAMASVPRERFVRSRDRAYAYDDRPLDIGEGQTISQPYIVALMAELLELGPQSRVLEIGTGSGYAAAVLSELAAEVHTVERVAVLADQARDHLRDRPNVHVHTSDGTDGWAPGAPYDAILVSAAAPDVPRALVDQLAPGGRLVLPVGRPGREQRLVRIRLGVDGRIAEEDLGGVAFVPMVPGVDQPSAER